MTMILMIAMILTTFMIFRGLMIFTGGSGRSQSMVGARLTATQLWWWCTLHNDDDDDFDDYDYDDSDDDDDNAQYDVYRNPRSKNVMISEQIPHRT